MVLQQTIEQQQQQQTIEPLGMLLNYNTETVRPHAHTIIDFKHQSSNIGPDKTASNIEHRLSTQRLSTPPCSPKPETAFSPSLVRS